jgi:hypothetical protein
MVNVWIEHVMVGWWVGYSGTPPLTPQTDGLIVRGVRIRNTFADGINFCNGTSRSVVEQSLFRNTGDDAIATWSPISEGPPATANVFRMNTAQTIWRANCFALYGGSNHVIEDNYCADTVSDTGVLISQFFNSHPFSGINTIQRNSIIRGGGYFPGGPVAAVGISAYQGDISGLVFRDLLITDSTAAGFEVAGPFRISGCTLDNVLILGSGSYGLLASSDAKGNCDATDSIVQKSRQQPLLNSSVDWAYTKGSGSFGW